MCIFCDIVNKKIPAKIVYEDNKILAFLDINPINKGHTLIIPKEHYKNMYDCPNDLFKYLMSKTMDISKKISTILKADGFNIHISNNEIAGQEVEHLHIHIIPQFKDSKNLIKPEKKVKVNINEIYDKLKELNIDK